MQHNRSGPYWQPSTTGDYPDLIQTGIGVLYLGMAGPKKDYSAIYDYFADREQAEKHIAQLKERDAILWNERLAAILKRRKERIESQSDT